MREIKFRVWDKDGQEMIGPNDFYQNADELPNGDKTGCHLYDFFTTHKDGTVGKEHENIVLMQFTGLKDKNGKEVFEGDFVKMVWVKCEGGGWTSDHKTRGVVCFDTNWGVKFDCRDHTQRVAPWRSDKCEKHWSDHEMPRDYRNIEVIGNIYENPELLKT